MLRSAWWFGALLALVGACSDREGPPPEADAGAVDASVRDGGSDAGSDAGTDASTDASRGDDGGAEDAGSDAGDGLDASSDADTDAQVPVGDCASDDDCRVGFCDYADDTCGGGSGGTCESPAEICPLDCPGVCGCDGRFYCNTCLAHASSVDVDSEGTACRATSCRVMDAVAEGDCDLSFGFAWNGVRCVGLSGCTCEGVDCAATFDRSEACEHAYRGCLDEPAPGGTCGGIVGGVCARTEYCDYEPSCAIPDAAGTCRTRPEVCIDVYDPVCGCDGRTYGNACTAASAGMDVASPGECGGGPPAE